MAVEIISWPISPKVWDRAGIDLATPGSAVRHLTPYLTVHEKNKQARSKDFDTYGMSIRKQYKLATTFEGSDKVNFKPACSATKTR